MVSFLTWAKSQRLLGVGVSQLGIASADVVEGMIGAMSTAGCTSASDAAQTLSKS